MTFHFEATKWHNTYFFRARCEWPVEVLRYCIRSFIGITNMYIRFSTPILKSDYCQLREIMPGFDLLIFWSCQESSKSPDLLCSRDTAIIFAQLLDRHRNIPITWRKHIEKKVQFCHKIFVDLHLHWDCTISFQSVIPHNLALQNCSSFTHDSQSKV